MAAAAAGPTIQKNDGTRPGEDALEPVELTWDDGTVDVPWAQAFNFETFQFEPAPGINEVTFITDASARGAGSMSHADVFIDNLRIVKNEK